MISCHHVIFYVISEDIWVHSEFGHVKGTKKAGKIEVFDQEIDCDTFGANRVTMTRLGK